MVEIKIFHNAIFCSLSNSPHRELNPDVLACKKNELDLTADTLMLVFARKDNEADYFIIKRMLSFSQGIKQNK